MSEKLNLLKLAKMLAKFGEISTDKGVLSYEGDLEVGLEVFIEQEGELVVAGDDVYETADAIISVIDGKIADIQPKEAPKEEAPIEEPTEEVPMEEEIPAEPTEDEVKEAEDIDALKARIAELEEIIKEKDAEIERLRGSLSEQEQMLKMSVEKPLDEVEMKTEGDSKALRYFN